MAERGTHPVIQGFLGVVAGVAAVVGSSAIAVVLVVLILVVGFITCCFGCMRMSAQNAGEVYAREQAAYDECKASYPDQHSKEWRWMCKPPGMTRYQWEEHREAQKRNAERARGTGG